MPRYIAILFAQTTRILAQLNHQEEEIDTALSTITWNILVLKPNANTDSRC